MDSNAPKFHVGARVESDLAQRFAIAARRDGRTASGALRAAMATYIADVLERDGAARAGATPSTTSEVAEPVGAGR